MLLTGVFPLGTSGASYSLTTAPTVQFVASDGTVFPAAPLDISPPAYGTVGGPSNGVNPDGTMTVSAVVPGGVLLPGVYSVRVTDNTGYSQTLSDVLTVVEGGVGVLKTNVIVPNPIGYHVSSTIYVQYSNVGDGPMPAPLLVLTAAQNGVAGALMTLDQSKVVSGFWTSATPDGYGQSVQFLASGAVPGILEPGESVSVPVYYAGWQHDKWDLMNRPPIEFSLGVLDDTNTEPIDWNSVDDSLRPPSVSQAAWNAVFPNLTGQLGPTWGQYVSRLDADAQYLAGLGENVTDIGQLFNFEVQQANGYSPLATLSGATDAQIAAPGIPLSFSRTFAPGILQRNQFGLFGWGWSSSWDTSLTVDPDGSVNVLGPAGSLRRFQPDGRDGGGFFDQPGDHGILTALEGGGYELTELDGQISVYDVDGTNGTLRYIQDSNGNRITAGYNDGRLTTLTSSGGQQLTLAYNAAGLVSSITDSYGRATTFHYDPNNEYLMSAVAFGGQTTAYTYDMGTDPTTAHALLSVAHSDGTHDYFTYDARGMLADAHRDEGADDTTFAYSLGQVRVSDAFDHTTSFSFDNRGLLVQVTNPLDSTNHYVYDTDLNLVRTIDAAGQMYSNTYDAYGNLLSSTDPLGNTVSYTYQCADDRLASVTDGNGNMTTYAYDGNGNLTSTTYADGTIESVAYDPIGNVIGSTNRKGQATGYSYDGAGNILSESFADGSQISFTYDAHENLISATDSTGSTTLSYDANDRLTQITYPSGRYLHYSYDDAGRRTQMVDQTGFTVNYGYDAQGNLATLTDGSESLIVHYTYDAAGRLSREDHGNGTYVTYDYDDAGELLHLVNYAPDGSVNSRFDYTYDTLGRRITQETIDGDWTYSYDAIGELTHAVFASTNPSATDQDLAYFYDAAGNRTQTIINGVTTNYMVNNLNEYTQVGDTTYSYDLNGNLTATTGPSGTTTYTYNAQNQLSGVASAAGTWTYQYDAFGNRIGSTQNGATTQYLIDPSGLGNVVATFDGSGTLTAHYTYGLGLVNQVAAGGTAWYYDFDTIGSTAGMTNAAGAYVNKYSYLPFGELQTGTATDGNTFRYVGRMGVISDQSELETMRSRVFSSDSGRFVSPDPVGLIADTQNLYQYGLNNPISNIDPSGLKVNWVTVEVGNTQFWHGIIGIGDTIETSVAYLEIPEVGIVFSVTNLVYGLTNGVWGAYVGLQNTFLGFIGRDASNLPDTLKELVGYIATGGRENTSQLFEDAWPFIKSDIQNGIDWAGQSIEKLKEDFAEVYRLVESEIESLAQSLAEKIIDAVNSIDPNSKTGPAGYGTQNFVTSTAPLPYKVNFENDPTATHRATRRHHRPARSQSRLDHVPVDRIGLW